MCQCAWRGVPECNIGASVQAASSAWERGNAGTTEVSLWLPPFLLLLSQHQASPSQYLLLFSWFPSLMSSFGSSPAGFKVLFLLFLFWFGFISSCSSWPNNLLSYDCAVFMCHREKFSNDYTKTFLFTISPKDFFRYVGRHWGLWFNGQKGTIF